MFHTLFRTLWVLWLRFARFVGHCLGYFLAVCCAFAHFEHLPLVWFTGLPVLYFIVQWFNLRLCEFWDIRRISDHWKAEDADPARNRLVSALGRVTVLANLTTDDLNTIWMHSLPLYITSIGVVSFCDSHHVAPQIRAALAYTLPPIAQAVVWGCIKYEHPEPEVTTIRGRKLTSYEAAMERQAVITAAAPATLFWGGLKIAIDHALTHFTLVGNNRSGKTVNLRLLLQSALRPAGKAVAACRALVFDPKTSFVPLLVGMGVAADRIRILNPFDARCWAWNMAADVQTPTDATNIAATMIPDPKEGKHDFFHPASRDILACEIIAFHMTCPEVWTLRDLLLVNRTPERVKELLDRTDMTRHALDRYSGDPRTLANIVATLRSMLVLYEPIASCWDYAGENRMSLNEWTASDKILVLGYSDTAKEQLAIINRCIFERLTNLLLSGAPDPKRGRTFVVLDEAREWGKLEGLHSLLVRGAEYAVNCVLGFQSVHGMWEVYGENSAGEVIGQANNLAVFRLGNDRKTAEWAADMIGKAQRLEKYRSQTEGRDTSQTVSESSHDRHLYMPEELQVLPATCPEHGLRGVFVSEQYGVVDASESGIDGKQLFGKILAPPDESVPRFVPRPHQHHYLRDWDATDLERLKLRGGNDSLSRLPRL